MSSIVHRSTNTAGAGPFLEEIIHGFSHCAISLFFPLDPNFKNIFTCHRVSIDSRTIWPIYQSVIDFGMDRLNSLPETCNFFFSFNKTHFNSFCLAQANCSTKKIFYTFMLFLYLLYFQLIFIHVVIVRCRHCTTMFHITRFSIDFRHEFGRERKKTFILLKNPILAI